MVRFGETLFFILATSVLAVLVLLMVFSDSGLRDWWHLRGEEDRVEAESLAVELENHHLAKKIKRLKLDLEIIEHMARHELGMIAEDEIVFRFKEKVKGEQYE